MHPSSLMRYFWERSRRSVSLFMVGVCITFFVGTGALTALRIVDRQVLMSCLGLSYPGIFDHLWLFQFLTAPLLHANVTHLLFNMLSLWMLGPDVEQVLGKKRYVLFSGVCAIASMSGFLLLDHGRGQIVLGYSGVIFGILVAQARYFPDKRIYVYFFPVKMKNAVLILGAVELYLSIAPEEGGTIAHAAHVFGALSAYGMISLWRWQSLRGSLLGKMAPPAAVVLDKRPLRRNSFRLDIPDKL